MTFRKLAAASSGRFIRAYFTENSPEPVPNPDPVEGAQLDPGGKLTSYYKGDDRRASWRPDMAEIVAEALGIDTSKPPTDEELDRLFEAKRGDTGAAWSEQTRKISAYDLTLAPHKSVTLAAVFAESAAETEMIRHAIDRAGDATMRYVAQEMGWARIGHAGEDGAEAGAVGWVAFRHRTARPTLTVQDGQTGITYLADVPMAGDPHEHTHYALFNLVATASGRIGSLDTKRLNNRVHEFGAYYQALLADELRKLGIEVGYDERQQAVVVKAIPQEAVDLFSKGRRQTQRFARAYAKSQGLDWETMDKERKFGILAFAGLASRTQKFNGHNDMEIAREQAEAIGWRHTTSIRPASEMDRRGATENTSTTAIPEIDQDRTDKDRLDRAYAHAAISLAHEFKNAAVLDHDVLRTFAARALIGTGIEGRVADIDRVVDLVMERGIKVRGENAAILTGMVDDTLRITNTAQVRIEEKLAAEAKTNARSRTGALAEPAIARAIEASGLDFDRDPEHGAAQKAAIYALGTGGNLSVLTGVAGSGKTTLLRPLVAAYKADTTHSPKGREVIGISTAWKQADALKGEAGAWIDTTVAVDPFLRRVEKGEITLSENSVVIIDEVSQVGPRPFLKLLELQSQYGFAIRGLGDQEQCQAIEAGDTIEILKRVLPKEAMPQLLSTVRQATRRGRTIAGLFRDGAAAEALAMKRQDGSAILVGGDQDQVVDHIADLYIRRRDVLRASGAKYGVTVSALTNEDAGDISKAIRERLKARGEIGGEERVFEAINQGRQEYDLVLAPGDRVRLYERVYAQIGGGMGYFGSNGAVVDVVDWTEAGVLLRDHQGRVGEVKWSALRDNPSGRLMLSYGHAVTVDSAQGMTSDEHINAMPRGTAGATGFKSYTAESRHVLHAYIVISEAALFEAVKHRRALGDAAPITMEHLWAQAAEDMSRKPYKPLGMDLSQGARDDREKTVRAMLGFEHAVHERRARGRKIGPEVRARIREAAVARALKSEIGALDEAIRRNGAAVGELGQEINRFLGSMRGQAADMAARAVAAAAERRQRETQAAKPGFSPSPF